MRLKYQLFFILLLASALMVALMAGIGRWNFDRGFSDYVMQIEGQRLAPLAEALAAGYAREGGWRWITANDQAEWRALIGEHVAERRRGRPRGRLNVGERPAAGARPMRTVPGNGNQPDPVQNQPPGPPPPDSALLTLDPRLLLADADRQLLIGRMRSGQAVTWQAVEQAGETVGYLGHRTTEAATGSIDQVFAAQQRRSFLYAALAMVPLSALLAIVVAARLVRPLHVVANAVKRIGRGEYAHRVPVQRKDEIGALARDIDRLAATLEANLHARRTWLAEISHELRTPVAILRGELEALQDGVHPLDQAAVASLHSESLRLGRLIDDLHTLTLSDAGALDYHFESLDLRELLHERLDAGRTAADERALGIELVESSVPVSVRADRQRLGQLIDNLLQNSLRYTTPEGKVQVTLGVNSGRTVIDWSDSAPGVESRHMQRLFDPLYRIDASRHRGNGGAGLGLAIVAKIVEAHDGNVSAQPSPLGGLTVRIDLPTDTTGALK